MTTSEKFCLRWNDFQENVNTAFSALRNDSDFTDVTLVCQDGYQVDAHKVILTASSPFFQKLLKKNKHAHPLIYMRGMNEEELVSIIDFLYYGEANIYQENLDSFLNIANELELKGLNGGEEGVEGAGDGATPKKQLYLQISLRPPPPKNKPKFDTNIAPQKSDLSSQSHLRTRTLPAGLLLFPGKNLLQIVKIWKDRLKQ